MNSSGPTHVDGNPANPNNDFGHHDAPHLLPDLGYPHAGYPPPPGEVQAAPGVGGDQRRLAQQTTVNPAPTRSRKRKSPPSNAAGSADPSNFPPGAADYNPGGLGENSVDGDRSPGLSHTGRPLNQGKRAEQNRKAQRAFRERREIHVKELEARSQLLDAALGSADEANRRWEECRALVDQLRVENAGLRAEINGLRAALGNAAVAAAQYQQHVQQPGANGQTNDNGSPSGTKPSPSNGKERGTGKGAAEAAES